jgi:hypothetical protein
MANTATEATHAAATPTKANPAATTTRTTNMKHL